MIALVKQWFAPPIFEGDEEKTRRARLLHAILTVVLIYMSVVMLIEVIDRRIPTSVIIMNGVGILSAFMLRRWLQRGKVSFVGSGVTLLAFIWVTLISINLGKIRNPTTAAYVFVVILAGVLFDWRGILVSTIASSLAVLGLILAENFGWLSQPDYTVTIIQWFTYTGLFGITGGMAYFTLETTQKALTRARNEITERRYTEMALKESQTRLQALTDSTIQSFMLLDRDGRVHFYNRAAAQSASILLGLDIQEGDPRTKFIIKGNSLGFNENFQKALKGEVITSENFLHAPNDQEVWLSFTYTPTHDEDGNVSGVCLNVVDITERKKVEEKLRQQNEYLSNLHQITVDLLSRQKTQTLLNNIVHKAMLLVNAHLGYIFLPEGNSLHLSAATPGFAHHIGRHEPQPGKGVLGLVWQSGEIVVVENYSEWEFRDPAYANEDLHAIAGIPIKIGNEIIGVLEVVNKKSSRTFSNEELQILTRFATMAALVLDNAQLLDATEYEISERKRKEASLQKHVAEIEQLQAELREQALNDPLTGLYNRRYLNEAIEREIAQARHEKAFLSVIVSDIDHFKTINDSHGHQIGDKLLTEIATVMKTNARESDIVCRYGGEEFLLVLPGANLASAVRRAEELRQKCQKILVRHEGEDLKVTMSFGVATYPDHGEGAGEIITQADKALYRSKQNGRNQVTLWKE